ncbi:YidB family protein [Simonsiella muelleri]|uniref:DUF937 domain-containing protein n=2 Tax=Simonsiella TaxID=71 RepID=V9H997_9NEIS|nr:YidB family protein [Simonsiella muelleri]AUX61947.1 ribosomal protein P2 [Simonsiella muelleri ATCC 29453]EFG31558.1 hypothetical protein HMPREF9021_00829 [Simonsiella muelleri ATCC 29453]UBQ54045.1 YidB family protein [Simonsiella muelleri]
MLNELISGVASSLLKDTDGDGQIQAIQLFHQLSQQNGGLNGLLSLLLQNVDLASIVQSWISNGSNAQPQASQIENALGSSLGQAAANIGLNSSQASHLLAQYLPQIINAITPNGNASDVNSFGMDDVAKIVLKQIIK